MQIWFRCHRIHILWCCIGWIFIGSYSMVVVRLNWCVRGKYFIPLFEVMSYIHSSVKKHYVTPLSTFGSAINPFYTSISIRCARQSNGAPVSRDRTISQIPISWQRLTETALTCPPQSKADAHSFWIDFEVPNFSLIFLMTDVESNLNVADFVYSSIVRLASVLNF